MRDAKLRRFDVIVVAKFDRFARSTRHLVLALEEFQALGVDFISLSRGPLTPALPWARWSSLSIAAVAELERSLIKERIHMGLKRARHQGKRIGRPELSVDLEEVHELRAEGLSLRAIGDQVGISHTKVAQLLRGV